MPTVLISILSWDQPDYLANLLANLDAIKPTRDQAIDYHVHVLDQGSGAETRAVIDGWLKRHNRPFRSARFLEDNIGFGPGHNSVFDYFHQRRPFDYFIMLNQDLLFGMPGWIDRLVRAMTSKGSKAGIGGPSVWSRPQADGRIRRLVRGEDDLSDAFTLQCSLAIVDSRAVERFGLFDTAFAPAYFEDADLSRRYAAAGLDLAWIDIEHVHAYFGPMKKLVRTKHHQLAERHGAYRRRNERLFCERWLNGPEPAVNEAAVTQLWPGVYKPS